ncbi:V-type proton ATPase subunit S1-like protein [Erinaceus europaeus]|uniref:V-type proton ATPase subunit S1-like protein n=1 Tax=Erinaceus europaeus TaxID=9365 RepID=A0ABM3Y7R1_ERIEU|nr:V-type proton ATPase subunit S1-like protein [Erinaceus europaeus]XP_060057110.1 V-type proton ATPase subunit S1-like protein [Erinaceus europaeus]XP_060057111.1 V-type proton ATPase subunit S1-like protein [Erinaceus europaeus]XP_060057112.1 V-type proton ATPase subunit S1-like protein [Erinaceus europaeus]XP_060057113.1 V-type proton ATPase subunit S1-like protein [Erinaceus europaeus]
MGRKILLSFTLIFLCIGFSVTLDQILARKNVSFISRKFSSKEVAINSDQSTGTMRPIHNFTTIPTTQTLENSLSRQGHLEKEPWNSFSHHSPINVSMDGIPCILFWTKRITVKFKNQTQLDLTDEVFGQKATVDVGNSHCSEENATLYLRVTNDDTPKGLDIRFTLINYNKLSIQSWFSLHRVEIIFNNSIQATFNATGIYAPSSHSYHCQHVSSLQRRDALLLPSNTDDMSSLWEVTFVDFQIQGFAIKGRQFAKARDCASSFTPAILIGLAMSLILLLVLAYALHMLMYLRYLDRHYDFIASPVHFPQLKARDVAEEKELLRSQGAECYELRNQQICKIYV